MTTFASPVDTELHGEYTINQSPDDPRPLYRFTGRITDDGSTRYAPEPGRYHIYAGLFCPWAQRVVLTADLAGLRQAVSVSYVDGARDGRGWAFREATGPDPVNGFELLRDAYDATEPGFDGHVSVPTLWDRATGRVVSNDYGTLDIDLASRFAAVAVDGAQLYPAELAAGIDELEAWLLSGVNQGAHVALGDGPGARDAAAVLQQVFAELDERLGRDTYLLGSRLTLADVRLWVTLVRYDAGAARQGAPRLADHPNLWSYARELYRLPAFARTTRFSAFGGTDEVVAQWRQPGSRSVGAQKEAS